MANEKELAILRSSYEMYEHSIIETEEKMKSALNPDKTRKYSDEDIQKTLSLMKEMQDDVKNQYIKAGGDINNIKNYNSANDNVIKNINEQPINEKIGSLDNAKENNTINTNIDIINNAPTITHNEISKAIYDVIPLPSNGECYKHKMGRIPVSYLTAYDENLIISPNLYRDGTFIDYLLQEKIMNSNINPSDLIEGDRDAIILWLRASGYGNEFPVTATDDVTGQEFETIVDLSAINYKPFNLKGDENGYFDYTLPISGDRIKFKFLTHKDQKNLERLETIENNEMKKDKLESIVDDLKELIKNDTDIDKKEKTKINESIQTIDNWCNSINENNGLKFTHAVTNKLELSIVSVNDITDRNFIKDYVKNMKVKDASSLRKYITENEPGLDFKVKVNKPESLGGGSMEIFLSIDQYLFLNIA